MAEGDAPLTFASITGLTDVIATLFSDGMGNTPVGSPVALPQTGTAGSTGTYSTVILAADVPAGAAFWQPSSVTLTDAGRSAFAIVPIVFEGSGGGGAGSDPGICPIGIEGL